MATDILPLSLLLSLSLSLSLSLCLRACFCMCVRVTCWCVYRHKMWCELVSRSRASRFSSWGTWYLGAYEEHRFLFEGCKGAWSVFRWNEWPQIDWRRVNLPLPSNNLRYSKRSATEKNIFAIIFKLLIKLLILKLSLSLNYHSFLSFFSLNYYKALFFVLLSHNWSLLQYFHCASVQVRSSFLNGHLRSDLIYCWEQF